MQTPFSFLRRLLGRRSESNVIQLFTPTAASENSLGTKLALAGATLLGLVAAGAVATGAFFTLLLALGAIYFLVTQVLGIRLDVDPRIIVQRAQAYASQSARN